jgi:Rifampin ADP-ribosyl transferase
MPSEARDFAHFYHGTKADLKPGDLLEPSYSSNFGERKEGELHLPDRNPGCGYLGSGTRGGRGTKQNLPCGTHGPL